MSLSEGKYTWNFDIEQDKKVNEDPDKDSVYKSETFEIAGLTWQLGGVDQRQFGDEKILTVMLALQSLPSYWKEIQVYIELTSNTCNFHGYQIFKRTQMTTEMAALWSWEQFKDPESTTASITLDLKVIKITSAKDGEIYYQMPLVCTPHQTLSCMANKSNAWYTLPDVSLVISPMINNMWHIVVGYHPKDKRMVVSLMIVALPRGYEALDVECKCAIKSLSYANTVQHQFTQKDVCDRERALGMELAVNDDFDWNKGVEIVIDIDIKGDLRRLTLWNGYFTKKANNSICDDLKKELIELKQEEFKSQLEESKIMYQHLLDEKTTKDKKIKLLKGELLRIQKEKKGNIDGDKDIKDQHKKNQDTLTLWNDYLSNDGDLEKELIQLKQEFVAQFEEFKIINKHLSDENATKDKKIKLLEDQLLQIQEQE